MGAAIRNIYWIREDGAEAFMVFQPLSGGKADQRNIAAVSSKCIPQARMGRFHGTALWNRPAQDQPASSAGSAMAASNCGVYDNAIR
ncbi:MAG: hypothetical protein AMJ46_14105 [Latescibacteria bacterium DG_63]|nr:MAG: hypothetical protein AMJ46_14105 [Latescibacteria bacterium DG_63]